MTEQQKEFYRAMMREAFAAYTDDPSATNYARLEQAMLEYQDAIYGDQQ